MCWIASPTSRISGRSRFVCAQSRRWLVCENFTFIQFCCFSFFSLLDAISCQITQPGPRTTIENLQPTFNVELKLSFPRILLLVVVDDKEKIFSFLASFSRASWEKKIYKQKISNISLRWMIVNNRNSVIPVVSRRHPSHWENIHIFNFSRQRLSSHIQCDIVFFQQHQSNVLNSQSLIFCWLV